MQLQERLQRYSRIERLRGRPLIVYATSTRPNVRALMSADAQRPFIDQIELLANHKSVDVLIHSHGGDPLVSWKIMSMLRERFEQVHVLVPYSAFSAATVFALGADQIVMHPYASLGPTDPQITARAPDGQVVQFAYEDLAAFLRFLACEVKLTEQQYVSAVADRLFQRVDPLVIGAAKRASDLSSDIAERLLGLHQTPDGDERRRSQIASDLNKTFFAHGDALSRQRASKLGLKVADSNPELETLMWEAYLGLESYMELRTPFSPVDVFLSDPSAAASVRPMSPLQIPPGLDPQALSHIMNNVVQQAVNSVRGPGVEVRYSIVSALIESPRVASECRSHVTITGRRSPLGPIEAMVHETPARWTSNSQTNDLSEGGAESDKQD